MAFQLLGDSVLGASSFFTSACHPDACGENGLPLTPKSVKILGRSQKLKTLRHPSLCSYIDLVRIKNDRLIQVCEYHSKSLEDLIKSRTTVGVLNMQKIAFQVLEGLTYLNRHGIVHRFLTPQNILFTKEGHVKLYNFGLYYMTDCGRDVTFPIGDPHYQAPEVLAAGPHTTAPTGPKVDVWALGIILFELLIGQHLYSELRLPNGLMALLQRIMTTVQNFRKNQTHPLDTLLKDHQATAKVLDPELRNFFHACLHPVPTKRPLPSELLDHAFFQMIEKHEPQRFTLLAVDSPFRSLSRPLQMDLKELTSHLRTDRQTVGQYDLLGERLIQEVYYLWSLAGGDLVGELKKSGHIRSEPPICKLPSIVAHEGAIFGLEHDSTLLFDSTTTVLSLSQLKKRLEHLTVKDYYPVLSYYDNHNRPPQKREESSLPVSIKESNVEYQFHRMVLYKRLIDGYPHTRNMILKEAKVDICPCYRGEIWAAILDVKGDIQSHYEAIDKETPHSVDRQIAVDIPRCHQYNSILSSPTAHEKLQRVLKSWVVTNKDLVYWQGLDSLCAPFVALNFENEALAYSCLVAFVHKYLHGFFRKDNSAVMQEYLALFSQLIAYHDPELAVHLSKIAFIPQLYAIPWYLTMFTHALSLPKIFHLWDILLIKDSGFPLCVGLAILKQIRPSLLKYDFNDCILFFSDMPEIDIQICVQDALKFHRTTPSSFFVSEHEGFHSQLQPANIPEAARKYPLPLDQLKTESSPQISPHDLVMLGSLEAIGYESSRPDSPTKRQPKRSKFLIVDVRPPLDYQNGHVPRSLNIPEVEALTKENDPIMSQVVNKLFSSNGKSVIVVVGESQELVSSFAKTLVGLHMQKVCVLFNGTAGLRELGLLSNVGIQP